MSMASEQALFPPTPTERLARIALFVSEERRYRVHMAWRHPDQERYWNERVAQCDEVLEHVAALAEVAT
jgi:hypothetical protein